MSRADVQAQGFPATEVPVQSFDFSRRTGMNRKTARPFELHAAALVNNQFIVKLYGDQSASIIHRAARCVLGAVDRAAHHQVGARCGEARDVKRGNDLPKWLTRAPRRRHRA